MNRIMKFAITSAVAATMATGAVAVAGMGVSSAAPRQAATKAAACSVSVKNYAFPRVATTYGAGSAGTVKVAPVNNGTIKVSAVHPARGWLYFVDTSSGSSVDVYFHNGRHNIKFEAEINDAGGLTARLTSC
jgi:hypothetical protein